HGQGGMWAHGVPCGQRLQRSAGGSQLGLKAILGKKNPIGVWWQQVTRIGRRPDQQQQQQQGEGKPIDRRPERRPPRERRFEKPAEDKGDGGEFSVDKPILDRPMRGRGGLGRGRGRGRGMGRGDGFDSRGKREFDRHSGSDRSSVSHSHFSGLKHEDKRGGSGSHNWGTVKDELTCKKAQLPPLCNCSELDQSAVTEETPEGEEHPPADSENKENEVEEVKEEGPKEMTLDEWKAIQSKDRAKVEFNIRKPNEGADGQWKKGFVLHKSKSEEVKISVEIKQQGRDILDQIGDSGRGQGGMAGIDGILGSTHGIPGSSFGSRPLHPLAALGRLHKW
uniref:Hyaluronan/mRNA-binding protein domain-containing protein n=1 Tax=Zonotrichia albicollis TaxID=44394 RepID=A0A8D2MD84_ZONAL